jgi:peptidoglycan L-alanyl-D-glutamate endopeptidase CwlK
MITLASADVITSRCVGSLQSSFSKRVLAWLRECQEAGLHPYIYEGLRTSARQTELYAIGRTARKSSAKVTWAKAGQSMHQYGLAIDFVPLVPSRKVSDMWAADWSDKAYAPYHKRAVKHGLRSLSWETPHLEDALIKDWRQAAQVITAA